MAVLGASSLQIDSATLGSQSGSAPMFACRAWVNFNGTTSPGTIRANGNVSSVTRNGTGDYTVNFSTAMPDANYSIPGVVDGESSNSRCFMIDTNGRTTTSCRVYSQPADANWGVARNNSAVVCAAIFR
jgi:hypothetical protein